MREILAGISFANALGRGGNMVSAHPDEGTSGSIELIRDRIRVALLPRNVQRYKGIAPEAMIGWFYCLSNFISGMTSLSIFLQSSYPLRRPLLKECSNGPSLLKEWFGRP